MRRLAAWSFVVLCAVAAPACGPASVAFVPTPSPREEALSWFPRDPVVVAIVATDRREAAVRRAGRALAPWLAESGLDLEQHGPLLGNDLVVGLPRLGDSPLAVIVAGDGSTLGALAAARVRGRLATPAGRYRSASLYRGRDHAFAVRHDVLAVARTTADLREALDRRAQEETLEPADLNPALPRSRSADGTPLVRAVVDLRSLLARVPARAREVPWLQALERAGLVVRGGEAAATGVLAIDTSGADLVERDLPVQPGGRGPRVADVAMPRVSVRDLAHVLGVADRAAEQAFPLAAIRLRRVLPHARALTRKLHGPATLVLPPGGGWMLRADPSRPPREELERLNAALIRAGVALPFRMALHRGVLVAGTVPLEDLRDLAEAPLARPAGITGAVAAFVPGGGERLPWPVSGWLAGATGGVSGELRVDWDG